MTTELIRLAIAEAIDTANNQPDTLDRLTTLAALRDQLTAEGGTVRDALTDAARAAQRHGHSYTSIGFVLGVSRQRVAQICAPAESQ